MTPAQFWQLELQNQNNQQLQQRYNQKMLLDGLTELGGAIKNAQDEGTALEAMDTGVGLMSDLGAITPDTRDKFMGADKKKKPLLFELLRQGAFSPFAAGQSAGFQAQAWDKYKKNWGSDGSGEPQGWTVY